MPRKSKEEYNEYMRNYMRKTARLKKGQPLLDDDYDASSAPTDERPVLNLGHVGKANAVLKEVFTNKPNVAGVNPDEDPVLKNIEKYANYIPLVVKFIQGFQAAAADQRMFNQQGQAQADNTPKPPAGWNSMTPMQKLSEKYRRPEWYAAGIRYDEYVQTGMINPQINTSYVDTTYDDAAARRREQMAQRQRMASGDDGSNPQSLRELSRKYPEPPLANDSPPIMDVVKEPEIKHDEKPAILKELEADNARYITMGINYLNGLSMENFEQYINNIDSLVVKAKPFIPLIPVQVKGMLQITTKEELEQIVRDHCPEKYAWLQKNKKIPKLLELFEKIKTEIVGTISI